MKVPTWSATIRFSWTYHKFLHTHGLWSFPRKKTSTIQPAPTAPAVKESCYSSWILLAPAWLFCGLCYVAMHTYMFVLFCIKKLCCVATKQDVNFFLVDLSLDGCLYSAKAKPREVVKTCSARLNRAHQGLFYFSVSCSINMFICSVNLCDLLWLGGMAVVAVCDVFNQPDITEAMKSVGLFWHRPFYYTRLKPRGTKAYENVSWLNCSKYANIQEM